MIKEEEKEQPSGGSWKTYARSMSWSERPPRKSTSTSKPQWNSKARASLPPLQPLSIVRPNVEEWPRAGSDDLGVWPNPPTPGARPGSRTPRENSTSDQPPVEFEFRKDKLAFFNKECSRILDHVYLGSDAIAKNRETLRENGITHVLNCVGFVCPEYFKDELVYKTLWLQDCPSEDITSILYDVFDYFEDVREQNGRVLVHCCQGVSRSTSLVIAYLMWKEGQSFDDAFQLVKSVRGVTNPNVGFACQLLQCQKRVHALPLSPSSVLRMYRMAPHSPYDPLHLVPKLLNEPCGDKLDSRGAFIVHIPSALYVWIGKLCSPVMSDNARDAASQVIRYERAQGPVITVKEGEETFEFWDALNIKSSSADERKVEEYDLDFEIFHGALAGGVVPPFPLSEAGSETCLPARENGWNRLRKKFANGVMKEFISSSKVSVDSCIEVEDSVLSDQCDSPDSLASCATISPSWNKSNLKEVGPLCDTSLSRSPSFSLVESFTSFLVNKPKSNSTSPSVSPSTSDYSSSFTFSPSSSNWSDSSFVSTQPSPYGLESRDTDPSKSGLLEESVGSEEGTTPANLASGAPDLRSNCGKTSPSSENTSQISENLTRYLDDDVSECNNFSCEVSFEMDGEEQRNSASNSYVADEEVSSGLLQDEKKYDMTNKLTDTANIVFYKWPSMNMHYGILDSRSVYIILMPAVSFGEERADVLYVWIGRNVPSEGSYSQLIRSDCEDGCAHVETIDRNLLVQKGFSTDAQIKIVKEGEEPLPLLQHLARFSLNDDLRNDSDGGIE